jgi:hypothetical protein
MRIASSSIVAWTHSSAADRAVVPICVRCCIRSCCLCRIGLPPFVEKVEGGRRVIPAKEET